MKRVIKFQFILAFGFLFSLNTLNGQDIAFMDGSFSYQQKADHYYNLMSYTKAEKFYKKALEKKPEDNSLQLKLARCYVQLNDPQNAKAYYDNTINESDAESIDILNYAEVLAANGEYEKASKWYTIYQKNHSQDGRVINKQEGIKQIEKFHKDSEIYKINLADFNSEKTDFATAFYNGQTLFISNRDKIGLFQLTNTRDESAFLDIYRLEGGQVSKFESISKALHEGPITFFDSGKKVMITTNHKGAKGIKGRSEKVKLKLVIYKQTNNGWEYEADFPYNNSSYSLGYPSYDEKNHLLYFASDMPGSTGGADIYTSMFHNGQWLAPQNLEAINTEGDEIFPYTYNGQELYFTSNGWGGLGGLDIYKVDIDFPENNVINLGYPVNTQNDDFGLVLDETGKKGYINSNRKNGKGGDDIYTLTVNASRVELRLVDKQMGEKLDGKFTVIDQKKGNYIDFKIIDQKAVFDAVKNRAYTIVGKKEGYISNELVFKTKADEDFILKEIPIAKNEALARVRINNLSGVLAYQITENGFKKVNAEQLEKTTVGTYFEINSIYFHFDSDVVESVNELEKLTELLLQHKTLKLEVIASCDESGSHIYNDKLSKRRAQNVINYLIKQGIVSSRIKNTAVGKRKLFNRCEDGQCSDKEHEQNRRVDFILIESID